MTQIKEAKVLITNKEATVYFRSNFHQIGWFAEWTKEIIEGVYDKRKKIFTSADQTRKFSVRDSHWASEITT